MILYYECYTPWNIGLTWLPKTPILHAEDTWSGPNHTAATFAGNDKMKTWNEFNCHIIQINSMIYKW